MTDEDRQLNREQAAGIYEAAAAELDRAALHLRRAATLFREGEIPRGCSHAWAAHGHVCTAEQHMNTNAMAHSARAQI